MADPAGYGHKIHARHDGVTDEMMAQIMETKVLQLRGKEFQELVERMLESLDRSPRSVQFLYANPVEAEFLARSPRFELIDVVRSWRPRADWTRTTSVSVYRVR